MVLADLSPIERLDVVSAALAGEQGSALARILRPLQTVVVCREAGPTAFSALFQDALIRLEEFDRVLSDLTGYTGHVYLLGDNLLGKLLALHQPSYIEPALDPTGTLEMLATCGLIYRFNAAIKFGYPSRSVTQFRLNGWGREQCKALFAVRPYWPVAACLAAEIAPFAREYAEVIALCASPRRPLNTTAIHRLNSVLPYAVVT